MRWSYKTVHYEMKKEGLLGSAFLDESEVEQSLNEYGKAGWELISLLETIDGLVAVFKQPLTVEHVAFHAEEEEPDEGVRQASRVPAEAPTVRREVDRVVHSPVTSGVRKAAVDQEVEAEKPQDIGAIRIE